MQPKFEMVECRMHGIGRLWQNFWGCQNKKRPHRAITGEDEGWIE
jgi:hypothetical protein